jgi:hypothetical protein
MRRIGITIALMIGLAGCGGKEGREVASGTVSDGEGGTADYSIREEGDGTSMTIKTEKGTAVVRTGADAAKFPIGFSLYPGAKVTSGTTVSEAAAAGDGGSVIAFESADDPSKVIAHYKQQAKAAGYAIEGEMAMNNGTAGETMMVGGTRGESGFSLTVTRAADKTTGTFITGLQ